MKSQPAVTTSVPPPLTAAPMGMSVHARSPFHRHAVGSTLAAVAVLAAVTLLLTPDVPAQTLYNAVELATVPEGSSRVVRSVNDAGDVVGGARIGLRQQAFAIRGRQLTLLTGLAGSDYSVAMGINQTGDIVGSANTGTAVHAFRATGTNSGVDLGTLPGDTGSEAFAINAAGQVVGASSGPAGIRAVMWNRDGAIRALPPVPGAHTTRALAVNDAGDTAGLAITAAGPRAVAWTNSATSVLGTLPGHRGSEGLSINNQGQIVGSSEDANGVRHAVLWTRDTAVQALGALAPGGFSRALGINDRTEVVGSSETAHGSRAFLWTPAAGIRDLNALLAARSGFVLTHAVAISPRGVIVALGQDETTLAPEHAHDHHEHPMRVFILSPQP